MSYDYEPRPSYCKHCESTHFYHDEACKERLAYDAEVEAQFRSDEINMNYAYANDPLFKAFLLGYLAAYERHATWRGNHQTFEKVKAWKIYESCGPK